MSLAFRNEIDIKVWLSGSRIADVAILPRSRPPLTGLFAGKPVAALSGVLPRLFSLCSVAHQAAFLTAVEAARGKDAAPDIVQRRIAAVIAERLTELLRGLFVGRLALDSASAAAVRAMMQAAAVLGGGISEQGEGTSRREAVSQIRAALSALGITPEQATPAPGSALAAHLASCDGDVLLSPAVEPSLFLSSSDDRDVVMRLLADGTAFSDAPELHGRVPETGIWARRMKREPVPPGAGPSERLKARIAEAARLCAWLEDDETSREDHVVESFRLGAGTGAAAVECARGRLYHAVELDDDDRIVRFEFLAPTEWNFHARGPLVRSLKGSALAAGRQGQEAVRTLVGSFDPCVGFSLSFHEAGHA